MSWDINLTIATSTTGNKQSVVDCGNYTYNTSPMMIKAINITFNQMDGMLVKDVIPLLTTLVDKMEKEPEEYKVLNPVNGWGDYDTFLKFIKQVLDKCIENDLCTFEVS